jgi:hypothetical protein
MKRPGAVGRGFSLLRAQAKADLWVFEPHLSRRLVVAEPLEHDLAQEAVIGPGQEGDLGHERRLHPMHAPQLERPA